MRCPKDPNHRDFKVNSLVSRVEFISVDDDGDFEVDDYKDGDAEWVEGEAGIPVCKDCGAKADLEGRP